MFQHDKNGCKTENKSIIFFKEGNFSLHFKKHFLVAKCI